MASFWKVNQTSTSGAIRYWDMIETMLAAGSSVRGHFLMRGYRPGTSDFETWIAVGAPNSTNPSGQPIVDVTVQAKWTA